MTKSQIDSILQSRPFRYILRIVVLYAFSIIFKSFDLSFPKQMGTILFRGQLFSIMFVILGLIIWGSGGALSKWIQKITAAKSLRTKVMSLLFVMVLHGFISAGLFGLCYALFDMVFFNKYEAWSSFRAWSYDLNFGIFIFYLLILGYNAVIFYYKNWQEARLKAEMLMRENIQAKYDVLKSQVDPHFFFNSLSVLTNLVYKSPDLAAEYITQLSKCYRYILDTKIENLVSVQTELSFLESYLFLIRIRHQDGIVFNINLDQHTRDNYRIPPATLQMLVENAVKHNRFAAGNPLHVNIQSDGQHIIVENELRKRTGIQNSTGVGLLNICKRYELITDKKVMIDEKDEKFIVSIPLLPAGDN